MSIRYSRWHHKKGADQASPEDLAVSRKVLGDLESQLAKGSVLSGARKVVMPDGTVIRAAITMGVPSVSIHKQPSREGRPREFAGDFVVWARTLALPDGHDPEHPQQALRTNDDASTWATLTYSGAENGARSDGTYIDYFPDGLARAGNIDWVSADGERISWYGPSSRVFVDAYIHPRHQFGKFVFFLGKPLLDIEDYIERSTDQAPFPDRYVTGAAIIHLTDGKWLYVMQSTGIDGTTNTTPDEPGGSVFGYPLAPQTGEGGLHRYKLLEEVDSQGIRRYRVSVNSRQKLAAIAIGHTDVWSFSQSGHEMIAHQILPTGGGSNPWWTCRLYAQGDDELDPEDDPGPEYYPATGQVRRRIALTTAGAPLIESFSVVSGGAAVPLASEFSGDEVREITIRLDNELVPWLGFDGQELPLRQVTAVGDIYNATGRWILYASPRDSVVVLLTENRIFDSSVESPAEATSGEGVYIETWVGGVQVNKTVLFPPSPTIPSFGLRRFYEPNDEFYAGLEGHSITPAWFIYGLFTRVRDVFAPEPDDADDTWEEQPSFIGAGARYANLAHPSQCYFGGYTPIGGSPVPLGTLVSNGFPGNQEDEDGIFSILGCAVQASEGGQIMLLSVAVDVSSASTTFALSTNSLLSSLTGVSGAGQRYHPLWAMGTITVEDEN